MSRYAEFKPDSDFCKAVVGAGWADAERLAAALKQSRATERSLPDLLCADAGAPEAELYRLLADKQGLPLEDLRGFQADRALVERVPIRIAGHYHFMPVRQEGRGVVIAVESPLNLKTLDEIRLHLGFGVQQVLARRSEIEEALKRHYGFAARTVERIVSDEEASGESVESVDVPVEQIDRMAGDASVINLVNEILYDAVQRRATDVHLEPYRGEFRLRYRVDGVLYDANLSAGAKNLIPPVLSRVKIMANLNIVERRLPQDGRAVVKVKNQNLDLRVSCIPTPHGESVVIRVLPTQMIFDLKKLGLTDDNISLLEGLIKKPHGIVLLTGPTGSGKSTTLYACLNKLNSKDKKIITIEDPVEYEITGITQIQVSPQVGLDFARGLRSMLRHDPDVMMVGEIRDFETAEIAIRAALTGHLVFSTLHTNDAASGATRLLDIGVEPYLTASSVEAIIAQRLVRTICPRCRVEDDAQDYSLKKRIAADLGLKSINDVKIHRGRGCDNCGGTGYHGRTALHEVLMMSEGIKSLILKKASATEIKARARQEGMLVLLQDGWKKVLEGVTTPAEVINVADFEGELSAPPERKTPEGAASVYPGGFAPVSTAAAPPAEAPRPTEVRPRPVPQTTRPTHPQNRSYDRTNIEIEVHYKPFDPRLDLTRLEKDHVAFSEDLSAGGMLIKMTESFTLGSLLELKFKIFEHGNRQLQCLARVVRVEETPDGSTYLVGTMFMDLSTQDRQYLDDFVKKANRRSAGA
ncbi:MAG: hypothetical protein MOGMAGMI_00406 [Candidatus Omnitrophica bacterium]|nr:hypothetical protein [Candidatus Omnitrophota bacterium]